MSSVLMSLTLSAAIEFAGCIAQVGEKVKDWKVGRRVDIG